MPGFLRAFSIILIALSMVPASAAEKLRVGKAVAFAWTFTPLDVGIQTGIFAKHGLEIEASAFNGDAKMQQGLTSDSIDVGIGGGPGMAFMVKGRAGQGGRCHGRHPTEHGGDGRLRFTDQDRRRPQG